MKSNKNILYQIKCNFKIEINRNIFSINERSIVYRTGLMKERNYVKRNTNEICKRAGRFTDNAIEKGKITNERNRKSTGVRQYMKIKLIIK